MIRNLKKKKNEYIIVFWNKNRNDRRIFYTEIFFW